MMQDVIDVFVNKTKRLDEFPAAYQEILVSNYRYNSAAFEPPYSLRSKMDRDTLELV